MGRSLTKLAEEQGHTAAADGKRVIDGCLDHLPVPCSQRDRPLQEKTNLVTGRPPKQGVSTSIQGKPSAPLPLQASGSLNPPSAQGQGNCALGTTLVPNRAARPTTAHGLMAAWLEQGCCRKREDDPVNNTYCVLGWGHGLRGGMRPAETAGSPSQH